MQTDSLFYELFRRLPNLLFELLGDEAPPARQYHFSSVEIKQASFRIDGVLRPDEEAPDRPIHFLEVQCQPKRDFYWRLFAEIFLFLEQEKPASNWHAVALFARRNLDPGLPVQYEALRGHLSIVYLDESVSTRDAGPELGLLGLIVAPEEEAIERAQRLREKLKSGEEPGAAEVNREMMELLETILIYKFPNWRRGEIEAMFELSAIRETRVFQEALEEGERKGKLETVPLLVQLGMSEADIARELGLDVKAVRLAAKRARPKEVGGNGIGGESG